MSAGEIVRSAALRIVRLTALLKRESLTGIGRGAVRAAEGEPGLGALESQNSSADFSLRDTVSDARQVSFVEESSQVGFLPLSPVSRTVARPAHARSRGIGEQRARVLNAMNHSAVFQAASAGRGLPGSALRWGQVPGVSGSWNACDN